MVRSPQSAPDAPPPGVQIAVADFDDATSLAEALGGVGAAYLVTPSSERAEQQQRRFADKASPLRRITPKMRRTVIPSVRKLVRTFLPASTKGVSG